MAKKKKKKKRGSRTHGRGNTKKGRGKGSRKGTASRKGGRNYMHLVKKQGVPKRKGFTRHGKEQKGINLRDINEMITEDTEEINLEEKGYQKVLGGGNLKKPITVKAQNFSNSAERKIEEKGGEAIRINEEENEN